MRNVLGVLEDPGDQLWSTFGAAVALASQHRSRLTLVKTRELRRVSLWCGCAGLGGTYVPPGEDDPAVSAARTLARTAEFVPAEIPLTTQLLGLDTTRDLRRMVETGAFDAVVASDRLLRRARRLRRECRRDGVETVAVTVAATGAATEPALAPDSSLHLNCRS